MADDDYRPQPNWYTNFKVKTIHTQMQHIGLICKRHFPATLTPTDTKTGTGANILFQATASYCSYQIAKDWSIVQIDLNSFN